MSSNQYKILLVDGARQICKTYIIRSVAKRMFKNFVEINLQVDALGNRAFSNIKSMEDFICNWDCSAIRKKIL